MTLPKDAIELKRLQKLWSMGLMDTQAEDQFDRITRMAKRLFDLPIAMVGLIDDERQWFKSAQGIDVSELPRREVFCDITLDQDQVFVIEDTLDHHIYRDYPMVSGDPKVRFYAGYPLKIDGEKLGTICVVDTKPRKFNPTDIQALRDLAGLVEEQVKLSGFAFTDELTQLLNRRGFIASATQSLAFCQRQKVPAALVFVDLDGFKQINDAFGHAEGDAALKAVSEAMRVSFRDCDLVARMGGDEFVALLPASNAEQAAGALSRLRVALDQFKLSDGQSVPLEFSSGISGLDPKGSGSILELLEQADRLMYADKNSKA